MTRPSISRLLNIARAFQRGTVISASELAEENHVSTRTIMRDIEVLVNEWDMPIYYNYKLGMWQADHQGCYEAIRRTLGLESWS